MGDFMKSFNKPSVFISSTCYDLKQIRTDIKKFIEKDLGYNAILSEYASFPLNTDLSAIDNCICVVKEKADIFVLIIGGRYGNVINSGKSITNLEYINAKAKGIPIYAFIEESIINILPVWRKNIDGDYSNIVDNPQLFSFVDQLYGNENIWVNKFKMAQDIISLLKIQFSYSFYDMLQLKKLIAEKGLSDELLSINGSALKIVLEKPKGWEYLLLGEIIEDSVSKNRSIRNDLEYGFYSGTVTKITGSNDTLKWIGDKFTEILKIVEQINLLFNKPLIDALGPNGEPGNDKLIIYVGEKLGCLYKQLITWGLDFNGVSVDDGWKSAIDTLREASLSPIEDIEKFIKEYREAMNLLVKVCNGEVQTEQKKLNLVLKLESTGLDKFIVEFEKAKMFYGI